MSDQRDDMSDEVFILDDSEIYDIVFSPVCTFCKHLIEHRKCKAFERIPDEIWLGHNDHRKPYPGDNGITFTPHDRTRDRK